MHEAIEEIPAPSDSRMTGREMMLLFVLAAVQFSHIVDFMIMMPLGSRFINGPETDALHMTTEQFGLVVSAYTVSAGLASLLAARFLDLFDRKTALLGLFAGFTGGTLLCAAATTYPLLLLARAAAGAFGGVCAANVLAIVGDAFPDNRRGRAMGVVMSAFSIASIAGIPIGLLMADGYGWRMPFYFLGAFCGVVLLTAAWVLPPLRGHLARRGPGVSVVGVAANGNHLRAFALMGSLVGSSFLVAPYVAMSLVANVGLEESDLKYVYLFGGLTTLLTLPVIGRLSDRLPKLTMFRVMALATCVSLVGVTVLPNGIGLTAVLAATTFMFVTTSGRMVPGMALITGSSEPTVRGSFMSLNSAVQQLGAGLASWLGGLLLHQRADSRLEGFALVGTLACGMSLLSFFLAGRLRSVSAQAPDAPALRSDDACLDESASTTATSELPAA